jgi:hypothetical protein
MDFSLSAPVKLNIKGIAGAADAGDAAKPKPSRASLSGPMLLAPPPAPKAQVEDDEWGDFQ